MYDYNLYHLKLIVVLTVIVEHKAKFGYFAVVLTLFYPLKNYVTYVLYFRNVYYQTVFKEPVLDIDNIGEFILSTFWCNLFYNI